MPCCASTGSSPDPPRRRRSVRPHRGAVRDAVGERRTRARSPTRSRPGCARVRRARRGTGRQQRGGAHRSGRGPTDRARGPPRHGSRQRQPDAAPRRQHPARARQRRHEGRHRDPASRSRKRSRRAAPPTTSRSSATRAKRSPTSTTVSGTCSHSDPSSSREISRSCSSRPAHGSRPDARARVHVRATFHGARAHTARPWMGMNAVHRAAPLLARLAAFEAETVEVDSLAVPRGAPGRAHRRWCRQQRRARPVRDRRQPPVRTIANSWKT